MVILPVEFIATKYSGYFLNTHTRTVYSLKVTGILRELKRTELSRWSRCSGYRVSVGGQTRWLTDEYLATILSDHKMTPPILQPIPVAR